MVATCPPATLFPSSPRFIWKLARSTYLDFFNLCNLLDSYLYSSLHAHFSVPNEKYQFSSLAIYSIPRGKKTKEDDNLRARECQREGLRRVRNNSQRGVACLRHTFDPPYFSVHDQSGVTIALSWKGGLRSPGTRP